MSTSHEELELSRLEEGELGEYRPLCVSAVVGLLLGLASPFSLIHPVLWFLPLAAVAVSGFALYRMANSDPMTGGLAARIGLGVGLLFAVWAPVRSFSYEALLRRDSQQYAGLWFSLLANGEPHKAYQLTVTPAERSPLDDTLWQSYRTRATQRQGLETYVQQPLVRTLVVLGKRAEVRLFDIQRAATDGRYDGADLVYAVSFDDQGTRKTFFVRVQLVRNLTGAEGPPQWRITHTDGGYKPIALGGRHDI